MEDLEELRAAIPDWEVVSEGGVERLRKVFRFDDFAHALAFTNAVAEIAEAEDHHPDLHLSWGRVTVELRTHVIGGLTENDFILAAKIDPLPVELKG